MEAKSWMVCLVGACLLLGASAGADVPGDADLDGDVDFDDFALLTVCQFGPEVPAIDICAELFDADLDDDVDLADLATLQRCASGESVPADPACAPHLARIEAGCLHIVGTAADSLLALRLKAGAPHILEVDVDSDGSADFTFDRGLFDCIVVDARAGDDQVWIDETDGVFTDTEQLTVNGGRGDDVLLGGSGGELFIGGPGHDTLELGGGADVSAWYPGDGNDVIDGGDGDDAIEIYGSEASENFSITANGSRVRFDGLNPTAFFLDVGTCENLVLKAGGGDDKLTCTGNLAALIQITADGGPGADTLLGSNGADVLIGGDGDDFVDGQQGNDVAFLGRGADVFQWDPGDGSDTIEGQDGNDRLQFNGSAASEIMELSAVGNRLRLARNVGNVVLDVAGLEQVTIAALGGTDTILVNNLAATAVTQATVDLGATGGVGDAAADAVTLVSTSAAETFDVMADAGFVVVDHGAQIRVQGYESADQLVIAGVGGDQVNVNGSADADVMTLTLNGTQGRVDATGFSAAVAVSGALSLNIKGQAGPDTISCTGNLASLAIPITLDGGPGDDTLLGSNAGEILIGGDDNDFVDGNQGNDVALLGAGDDTFQWDPGDGNDIVEGQDGDDLLQFNGSNASEIIDLSANGARLRLTRNVANIVMDVDGVEEVAVAALGGVDNLVLNDLSATAVALARIDLGTFGGAGDAAADQVTVNGTSLADIIHVGVNAGLVEVTGLPAWVQIMHSEPANDTLTVNGLGGTDTLTADPGVTALIMLLMNQ